MPNWARSPRFTQAVMAKKGAVSDAELKAFDAGYNQQQAVEVVMGVALATFVQLRQQRGADEINPGAGVRLN